MRKLAVTTKVLYPELSYRLTGFFFKMHNELGRYRNEKQYADAIEYELRSSSVPYVREAAFAPSFEGESKNRNICDFIVDGKIIIEVKTESSMSRGSYFQVKRYLSSSGLSLGILVNFRERRLVPKRILHSAS
jgi:GxxExxY protein